MSDGTKRERVNAMLRETLQGDAEFGQAPTEATRFEELGMDSLDAVEFVMGLEEEFDADIADETAEGWHTLGDVYRWAEGL